MLDVEKKIPQQHRPWWSEELHKAYLVVRYWRRQITYKKRGKEDLDILHKLVDEIGIEIEV
eukprot:4416398-Ditylum_brightwellii.AAC.1